MSEWKNRLAEVDDDYLIGLANKGIVKRAYKDKEETVAEVVKLEEDAEVKVGGETVLVRYPIGESKCSCPSRSICRHVVLAILVLREAMEGEEAREEAAEETEKVGETKEARKEAAEETEKVRETEEAAGEIEKATETKEVRKEVERETEKTRSIKEVRKEAVGKTEKAGETKEVRKESAEETEKAKETEEARKEVAEKARETKEARKEEAGEEKEIQGKEIQEKGNLQKGNLQSTAKMQHKENELVSKKKNEKLLEEICSYPLKALKKTLGVRNFQSFISQMKAGIRPEIQYSSIITVKLPQQDMTVKLLSPLAYSSCTCHKKEFCIHKARAVLWCQLEANVVTEESLMEEAIESMEYDLEQIRKAAGQMKAFLDELLGTGLSRTSPDVLDYLERLAIISHNANLPKYEGYFRALFDSYGKYLKRMASFQTRDLMAQITRLYRRVELLLEAKNSMEIAKYAGEFKADYNPVGNLDLIGVAMERFSSQTGYEGETVYFLEEHTKKWYSYTVARPVFYENSKRSGKPEKGQAPWGTMVSLEELSGKRIHLAQAKCDERNRLSSSQETRGIVTGERNLTWKDLEGWHYQDFGKLFAEQIGLGRGQWLREQSELKEGVKLVLIQPDSCEKAEFSETDQRLSMILFDKAGREVVVEVTYSKKEEGGIQYLERIRENRLPCFLGKVYLRDGRIRMYPVALVDRREIRDEWV